MRLPIALLWCLIFLPNITLADNARTVQTKNQLEKVKQHIVSTNKVLAHTKRQQLLNQKQLAKTEKKINVLLKSLRQLNAVIDEKKKACQQQQLAITTLDQSIKKNQSTFANALRLRYQLSQDQPVKWLLYPQDKTHFQQQATYFHYIFQSINQTIHHIEQQQQQLQALQVKQIAALNKLTQLRQKQRDDQQRLGKQQQQQQQLVQALSSKIRSQTDKLHEYQRNKQKLTTLLIELAKQSRAARSRSILASRHHLKRPVAVDQQAMETKQQGLLFHAKAGATVTAVHAGKVVFSNWLKGYGLLIILDHGHGYMTLYAHNQVIFTEKGDWVDAGEKIAEVGHSGGLTKNGLYFEIRHNGKAISPANWFA